MLPIISINYDDHSDLIELVAQFDAGEMTRSEFQRRVRALPNERLLIVSRILTAGRGAARERERYWERERDAPENFEQRGA